MSEHLTAEEFSRLLAGECDGRMERHLLECAACAAEVARTEQALLHFRGAVREWSGAQAGAHAGEMFRVPAGRPSRSPIWHAGWAVAATALLIAAAIPLCSPRPEPAAMAKFAAEDAQLLEQVDVAVSQSVPSGFEPLMSLVAWDTRAEEKETHETSQNE